MSWKTTPFNPTSLAWTAIGLLIALSPVNAQDSWNPEIKVKKATDSRGALILRSSVLKESSVPVNKRHGGRLTGRVTMQVPLRVNRGNIDQASRRQNSGHGTMHKVISIDLSDVNIGSVQCPNLDKGDFHAESVFAQFKDLDGWLAKNPLPASLQQKLQESRHCGLGLLTWKGLKERQRQKQHIDDPLLVFDGDATVDGTAGVVRYIRGGGNQ